MKLFPLLLLLFALPAWADATPQIIEMGSGSCSLFLMCNAQTAAGDCDTDGDATGDEFVLFLGGQARLTFDGIESTGNYSFDVYTNTTGHDAASTAGEGQRINAASITQNNQEWSVSGNFWHVWVNVVSVATTVNVRAIVCPL